MEVRELSVPGAWAIRPQLHADERGVFCEWFTDSAFTALTGHRFELRQANCSVSAAGVLRVLHFAEHPPSQAKYVTCAHGSVFDVVVDIRVGSPTFGQWDGVLLNPENRESVYVSEGLAHAFLALQDDTTVIYLCSNPYDPDREHTICATDPALGIEWPAVNRVELSERDAAAPTLEQVRASGRLPSWDGTRAFIDQLRSDLATP